MSTITMAHIPVQAINGVMPPQTSEARIRDVFPSVAAVPVVATLGRMLTATILLAPVAWVVMSGIYFGKLLPFMMTRYCLTNRRIMIRKGWSSRITHEVALSDIDDVTLVHDGNSAFFRSANLDIISAGRTVMTLPGVSDPESLRHMILDSRNAWVPGKSQSLGFISAASKK